MHIHPLRMVPLLACLLAGCSAQILEDVGEIGAISAPRNCAETGKLFNTFSMRAKSISWKGTKSDPAAVLTLELVFDNDKKFPVALSNSGNGVLYAVEFSLNGEKGTSHKPKEASGVALAGEQKQLNESRSVEFFRQQKVAQARARAKKSQSQVVEKGVDVNFRIKPGQPELGKLVFEVPRNNYLLTIERKFANKPVSGMPTDHVFVCKISGAETAAVTPAGPQGISGVY